MVTGTGTPTRSLRPATLLIICAVALAGWIVYLGFSLDQSEYVVRRWGLAWIGLDIAETAGLLVTALLWRRHSSFASPSAAVTGTLFLVDAWFDMVTAAQGADYGVAILLAVFAELPLGIFCAVLAARAARWSTQTR